MSTRQEQIPLAGIARAQGPVRDVYITVYNPARHPFEGAQKVYYMANEDPSSGELSFSSPIPLEPGNNLIEVFARGEGDVMGWSRHWVLRSSGLEALRTSPEPAAP